MQLVALDPREAGARHLHFTNIVMGMFKACHLGYTIDKEHEGQGLMREVVAAGIDRLFRGRACIASWPATCPRTCGSGASERLGFEQEGYARDYLMINMAAGRTTSSPRSSIPGWLGPLSVGGWRVTAIAFLHCKIASVRTHTPGDKACKIAP